MRKLISMILLVLLAACTPSPVPPCAETSPAKAAPCMPDAAPVADVAPPAPDAAPPAPEAAPVPPQPADACSAGEAKLLSLGCKDERGRLIGGPNLHGVGWAVNCRIDADAGVNLHAICIAASSSCTSVMACK